MLLFAAGAPGRALRLRVLVVSRLVVGVGVGVDGRLGSIQRELSDSKDVGWKTCSPRLAAGALLLRQDLRPGRVHHAA